MKYADLIENKHRVIRIGKAPQYDNERQSIANHIASFPNGSLTEKLREVVGDVDANDYFDQVEERAKQFKGLLFSTWKMCLENRRDGKESPLYYIFPYKYNDTNHYLFYLESPIYNNFYHINGLTEGSADVTCGDFWARGDLVFYEVDFSEMLEHAKMRCDEAAEVRLTKIIERDLEIINDSNEQNG